MNLDDSREPALPHLLYRTDPYVETAQVLARLANERERLFRSGVLAVCFNDFDDVFGFSVLLNLHCDLVARGHWIPVGAAASCRQQPKSCQRILAFPCRRYRVAVRAGDALPDPRDASFYCRHVEICRRAGVEPSPPERVRELVSKWNAMLKGQLGEKSD